MFPSPVLGDRPMLWKHVNFLGETVLRTHRNKQGLAPAKSFRKQTKMIYFTRFYLFWIFNILRKSVYVETLVEKGLEDLV